MLEEWVELGLAMDLTAIENALETLGESHSAYDNTINDQTRQWWAFKPISRPEPPLIGGRSMVRSSSGSPDFAQFIIGLFEPESTSTRRACGSGVPTTI